MTLSRNITANFVGQAFQAVVRLLVAPIYLSLMGIESYGLVGIFILFAGIIQFFNFGFSSAMSREIAQMRGGAVSAATVRLRLRYIAAIMLGVALVFTAAMAFAAPTIAVHWLKVETLPVAQTVTCLRLMALAAAISFVCNLYRAGLLGLERQVQLNTLLAFFTTVKSIGVIAVLVWVSSQPAAFFTFQIAVATIEIAVTAAVFYRHLPPAEQPADLTPNSGGIGFKRFAGAMAFTDLVWAGVLQADRLVLSTALPLAAFGYFTLTATAAYGVLFLFAPILQALQPRFAVLAAEGRYDELRALYLNVSHGVAAVVTSAGAVLAFFPQEFVFAWTGNHTAASWAATVLPLYAIGNAAVGIISLPFLLQFALGKIRLHVIGHILDAIIYLPIVVWLGLTFGARGTGAAWLTANLLYLLLWTPLIYANVLPGQHKQWLLGSILPPVAVAVGVVLIERLLPLPSNRAAVFLVLMAFGGVALLSSLLTSGAHREMALTVARRVFSQQPGI